MTTPKQIDFLSEKGQRRLANLVRRYLKKRGAGKQKFQESGEILKKAISAGLMTTAPVEVDGEKFILVDNFSGDKTGGWATVPRFSIEPLSKKAEKMMAQPQVAHTAEAGV